MFQSFEATTTPETAHARLADLRVEMKRHGVDGFLIPRADVHQGEYVIARDQRLAWLTSFTGSAGFCAVLRDTAGLFVDGRYTIQTAAQVDTDCFEIKNHPSEKLADYLNSELPKGGKFGFDPWLHTAAEIEALKKDLKDIELVEVSNLIDAVWADQPDASTDRMVPHPLEFAGVSAIQKINDVAAILNETTQEHVILTQPDSIAWLLNTRGTDLGQTPVALCFAVVSADTSVQLFIDPRKVDDALRTHLPDTVTITDIGKFKKGTTALTGKVRLDKKTAPIALLDLVDASFGDDPTTLPKAQKNAAELAGARAAHIRDGAAVSNFLAWLSGMGDAPNISEIDVVEKLEQCRRETGELKNISFDTISGSGPNGAIVHYRVNTDTNRQIQNGDVLLLDSGAQYLNGTTDITRTIAIGDVGDDARRANTLVLKGMIAISKLRFPRGLAGRDIDAIARHALWSAGLDFDHGTGHGVGSYLSVHEGPQGISRRATAPFGEGMIVSNEPGYYKEGAFGIRIENLIYVIKAPELEGGDNRDMLAFETLTLVPIDKNMIAPDLLLDDEIEWLNSYHRRVYAEISALIDPINKQWLTDACAPL